MTLPEVTASQTQFPHLVVMVNSNQDGQVHSNDVLTLREAIAIVNGTLSLFRLSDRQKTQVQSLSPDAPSRIEFNLPRNQSTIRLVDVLPPLANPGLVVDGTTQPGYASSKSTLIPVVEITPAPDHEVFRGLTVAAHHNSGIEPVWFH